MKRRGKFILLGALVAMAGLLLAAALWWRGPSHNGRSLDAWLADLNSSSGAKRQEARDAVKAMGPGILPDLMRDIRGADPTWRLKLMEWMAKQKWLNYQLTPATLRRERALWAVETLGAKAAPVIPEVIGLLPEPEVSGMFLSRPRDPVVECLQAMGDPVVAPALAALQHGDPKVRTKAAALLPMLPVAPDRVMAAVQPLVRDPDAKVRRQLAAVLVRFHFRPGQLMAMLRELVQDRDSMVRLTVIETPYDQLSTAEAVELLLTVMADADPKLRLEAVRNLRRVGGWAKETKAVLAVAALLADPAADMKLTAIRTLESAGAAASRAVPALVKACGDESPVRDDDNRRLPPATRVLMFGTATEAAMDLRSLASTITNLLPLTVGDYARQALGKVDAVTVVPLHLEALQSADARVRNKALLGLTLLRYLPNWAMWEGADAAPSGLQACLKEDAAELRCAAAVLLARYGAKARAAVPLLTELYEDKAEVLFFTRLIGRDTVGIPKANPIVRKSNSPFVADPSQQPTVVKTNGTVRVILPSAPRTIEEVAREAVRLIGE